MGSADKRHPDSLLEPVVESVHDAIVLIENDRIMKVYPAAKRARRALP